MFRFLLINCLLLTHGCMTVYECEGDHKEQYNNISPTTQQSDTTNSGDKPPNSQANTSKAKL
ncbi:hypothetical protein DKL61_05785 [Gammaproteobacteria bacterium ESL0073]|nr:hypothetical protein DKL61_05785 [Gammaproteobacteria bacterium ESL0073]